LLNTVLATFSEGVPPIPPTSFESIATVTASGGESSLSLSSIPGTYKHLQVRYIARNQSTAAEFSSTPIMTLNNDSALNYADHYLQGNGSAASAVGSASGNNGIQLAATSLRNTSTAGIFGVCIVDIIDYASTTKNKTVRYFGGVDTNTASTAWRVTIGSGLWLSTSAVTSLEFYPGASTWLAGSTFALYGIKG
jgi:hypothetical protein